MEDELCKSIKNIVLPQDYFKGLGERAFPIPSEILFFYRDKFGDGLYIKTNDIHYRYVFILNLGDPIKMLVDGESIELKSDCFILVLPYQYHRYFNNFQKNIFLFFITFEMSENLFFEQFRNATFQFAKESRKLLNILIRYYQNNDSIVLPYFTGYFLAHLFTESIPAIIRIEKTKDSRVVYEVCRMVYRDKKLKIDDLCDKTNLSDSYLRRVFKKNMGITLGKYIFEIRLFEAMKLLTITDLSIGEISEKTGYDSIYSFSRSFHNAIGSSPKAFREIKKNQDMLQQS